MQLRGLLSVQEVFRKKIEEIFKDFETEHKEVSDVLMVKFGKRSLAEVTGDDNIPKDDTAVCTPVVDENTGKLSIEIYVNTVTSDWNIPFVVARQLGSAIAVYELNKYDNIGFLDSTAVNYERIMGIAVVIKVYSFTYAYNVVKKMNKAFCKKVFAELKANAQEMAFINDDSQNIIGSPEDFATHSELIGLAIALGKLNDITKYFSKCGEQFNVLVDIINDLSKLNADTVKEMMRGA